MADYRAPGWFTRVALNGTVGGLTRLGVSVWGSRLLRVRGRRSGEWRTTPVNVLVLDGARYVVAPRGETQWVRNLRAAGTAELVRGRHTESVVAVELTDDEKPPVLRAYLARWKLEVGVFFEGVDARSSEADMRRIAPAHPIFRIEQARSA